MMNVTMVAPNRLRMLDEENKPPDPLHSGFRNTTMSEGMVTNMDEEDDEIENEEDETMEMVDATPNF